MNFTFFYYMVCSIITGDRNSLWLKDEDAVESDSSIDIGQCLANTFNHYGTIMDKMLKR